MVWRLVRDEPPREVLLMQTPDVIVLVPGFLGFARFGGFYYFADRLIAVLRGLLEEPLGYPLPVVPLETQPTASATPWVGRRVATVSLRFLRSLPLGVGRIRRPAPSWSAARMAMSLAVRLSSDPSAPSSVTGGPRPATARRWS